MMNTFFPRMLPPVNPTSEAGVFDVWKSNSNPSEGVLFDPKTSQVDPTPIDPVKTSNADKPGNMMSKAVTIPVVTSTVSVPENEQLTPLAQVPRVPPDMLSAVPDTLNESAWACGALPATSSASTSQNDFRISPSPSLSL